MFMFRVMASYYYRKGQGQGKGTGIGQGTGYGQLLLYYPTLESRDPLLSYSMT